METLRPPARLEPFVREILYLADGDAATPHALDFYADGFAGIVYSRSATPFTIQPQDKVLPDFYLYGQTIVPMTLAVRGAYELYALRLYPFAVRTLLGVDPRTLNDDCFDLRRVGGVDTPGTLAALHAATDRAEVVRQMTDYFGELLRQAATQPDRRIVLATNMILKSEGNVPLPELRAALHTTERTLERQFMSGMGVTPLQFARIIRFQSSLRLLSEEDYLNLTEVGSRSGYADQSHFIRNFKRYTGKTPREFRRLLAS